MCLPPQAELRVPRDKQGPRGCLRLYIKTGDTINDFEQVSTDKEIRQEEKLGNKCKKAVLDERLRFVAGASGLEKHELIDMAEFKEKALLDIDGSSLQGDGLLGPDIADMMHDATRRRRKAKDDDIDGKASSDEDAASSKGARREGPEPSPCKGGWLDETKINKHEREFGRSVQAVESLIKGTQESIQLTLAEFRSTGDDAKDFLLGGVGGYSGPQGVVSSRIAPACGRVALALR